VNPSHVHVSQNRHSNAFNIAEILNFGTFVWHGLLVKLFQKDFMFHCNAVIEDLYNSRGTFFLNFGLFL